MDSLLIPDSSNRVGAVWELLPHVSRTFALTIPILEAPLCDQVAIAYLLCRVADTIEDAEGIPPVVRRELFHAFLEMVQGKSSQKGRFQETWCGRVDPFHEELILRSGEVLEAYAGLPDSVRAPIEECLAEMVRGMESFLDHPGSRRSPHRPCRTLNELERYCHVVAGTVGILLTRLFAPELPPSWSTPSRYEEGRRFGLGLQLTNVLKDADADGRRGVSYLPQGHQPGSLIDLALGHFDAAQSYILSLPVARSDMRLFCVWACHLALATLARIACGKPAKVPRGDLSAILEHGRTCIGDDGALEDRYRELRGRITAIR